MFGTWGAAANNNNNNTATNPAQPAAGGFGTTTNAFGQPAQNTGEWSTLLCGRVVTTCLSSFSFYYSIIQVDLALLASLNSRNSLRLALALQRRIQALEVSIFDCLSSY
jgi:hypothetical protein